MSRAAYSFDTRRGTYALEALKQMIPGPYVLPGTHLADGSIMLLAKLEALAIQDGAGQWDTTLGQYATPIGNALTMPEKFRHSEALAVYRAGHSLVKALHETAQPPQGELIPRLRDIDASGWIPGSPIPGPVWLAGTGIGVIPTPYIVGIVVLGVAAIAALAWYNSTTKSTQVQVAGQIAQKTAIIDKFSDQIGTAIAAGQPVNIDLGQAGLPKVPLLDSPGIGSWTIPIIAGLSGLLIGGVAMFAAERPQLVSSIVGRRK